MPFFGATLQNHLDLRTLGDWPLLGRDNAGPAGRRSGIISRAQRSPATINVNVWAWEGLAFGFSLCGRLAGSIIPLVARASTFSNAPRCVATARSSLRTRLPASGASGIESSRECEQADSFVDPREFVLVSGAEIEMMCWARDGLSRTSVQCGALCRSPGDSSVLCGTDGVVRTGWARAYEWCGVVHTRSSRATGARRAMRTPSYLPLVSGDMWSCADAMEWLRKRGGRTLRTRAQARSAAYPFIAVQAADGVVTVCPQACTTSPSPSSPLVTLMALNAHPVKRGTRRYDADGLCAASGADVRAFDAIRCDGGRSVGVRFRVSGATRNDALVRKDTVCVDAVGSSVSGRVSNRYSGSKSAVQGRARGTPRERCGRRRPMVGVRGCSCGTGVYLVHTWDARGGSGDARGNGRIAGHTTDYKHGVRSGYTLSVISLRWGGFYAPPHGANGVPRRAGVVPRVEVTLASWNLSENIQHRRRRESRAPRVHDHVVGIRCTYAYTSSDGDRHSTNSFDTVSSYSTHVPPSPTPARRAHTPLATGTGTGMTWNGSDVLVLGPLPDAGTDTGTGADEKATQSQSRADEKARARYGSPVPRASPPGLEGFASNVNVDVEQEESNPRARKALTPSAKSDVDVDLTPSDADHADGNGADADASTEATYGTAYSEYSDKSAAARGGLRYPHPHPHPPLGAPRAGTAPPLPLADLRHVREPGVFGARFAAHAADAAAAALFEAAAEDPCAGPTAPAPAPAVV
ncbi:hypothetical protein B0H16DRAFT_1692137 [Mycena metata]|uniref:Uncharacterized protein n=1 Tax=Mycena metata TaxID=1033252 RepID=A0AAD7N6Y1_9AGAR|nr:hypothetical protein B0H16DRAFT_1692137 [Mycena metata]